MNKQMNKPWLYRLIEHRVACDLLMWVALLLGFLGVYRINVTLFPEFDIPIITVVTPWPGASADAVEKGITQPLEMALKGLNGLETSQSWSRQGVSVISLTLTTHTPIDRAFNEVERLIKPVVLPDGVDSPVAQTLEFIDPVASVLLGGQSNDLELRQRVNQLQAQLLSLGAAKVEIRGLRDEVITIALSSESLSHHQLTLSEVMALIKQSNTARPLGNLGLSKKWNIEADLAAETVLALKNLALVKPNGQVVLLGDMATITRGPKDSSVFVERLGKPMVELQAFRGQGRDSVSLGQSIRKWASSLSLPSGLSLTMAREVWTFVYSRMSLLLNNALAGLGLVMAVLTLFLGWRLSIWVVVGIPIAIFLSLFFMYAAGYTVNMMSSFAFILALGIIVDDAIVVAEETSSQRSIKGQNALEAAYQAAKRMWLPVLASSLTTVAALLPLLLITGVWGDFMRDIPVVIIAVIIASLFECFLILPGHLGRMSLPTPSKLRQQLNAWGQGFINQWFRPLVSLVLSYHWLVLVFLICLLTLTSALITSGQVPFEFYSGYDSEEIVVNVEFQPSTDLEEKKSYMRSLESSLNQLNQSLGGQVIQNHVVMYQNKRVSGRDRASTTFPERYAAMIIELQERDKRQTSNNTLLQAWAKLLPSKPRSVVSQDIRSQRSGPAVSDLQFSLRGNDVQTLKAASQALKTRLATYQGVSNINDDMPTGTEKLVLHLKPEAIHQGLTLTQISEQVNRLLTPQTLMTLYEPNQSVEVKLGLTESEAERWSQLSHLPITLKSGETLPLHVLADFKPQEGFDLLSHRDGQLAVEVSATVDLEKNNARAIQQQVWADDIGTIQQTFGIEVKSSNDDNRQDQALSEMTTGLFLGLGLMIVILTAVFSSYLWPLAVMLALPLGLTGAVLGHWLLGFSLGLFSLFGMFTLSGIVVNDAIILLVRYRELLKEQSFSVEALVEACCQRLRPVLLTSITTILGLLPILIDQSATARYFHATAATIVFGLMFASIWILFVIPGIVCVLESVKQTCLRWINNN